MRNLIYLVFLLMATYNLCAQNSLYVFYEELDVDVTENNECGDYEIRINSSHTTGSYLISEESVNVFAFFQEGYNDDPTYACNGPCGVFNWTGKVGVSKILNPFEYITYQGLSFSGFCPIGQNQEESPFNFHTLLLPELIQQTNTIRCTKDQLFDQYIDNLDHEVENLVWQYSIDGNQWENFSNNVNRFPFDLSLEQGIGEYLASSFINKTIHLRYKYISPFSNNELYSNAVFFDIKSCAPSIESVETEPLKCFNEESGVITIYFNRTLESGELISIVIIDLDNQIDTDENDNPIYQTIFSINNISEFTENNSFIINENNSNGLPPGNYRIQIIGGDGNGSVTSITETGSSDFTIESPTPVEFITKKINVWCNEGGDGEIAITAKGGIGNYEYVLRNQGDGTENWKSFSAATTHTIKNLTPDTYEILVRDGNACVAKEIVTDGSGNIIGLGEPITDTIEITEPNIPVAINYTYSREPTAYGFSNGEIVAQVTGGTPLSGGAYNYTWTYEDGTVWTDVSRLVNNNNYYLTLNNAVAGIYTLTVTDANYNSATDKEGCTIQKSEFELTQPDPLIVKLSVYQEISCHTDNEFGDETDTTPPDGQRDESQDGAILATVTGGVQFNSGSPYIYTWKKQNTNGTWTTLGNQTNNIATELSDGNYAFNVKDANGITLGDYANNLLTIERDSILYLHEPSKLELTLSSKPTTCASGSNGSVSATATGGTPPYTYYWSNGEIGTISEIQNLSPSNYFVQIMDSKGCLVQGNIAVKQPDDYYAEVIKQVNPTCFGGNDGYIDISIFGGSAPYTYEWNTGATTEDINNLGAGTYSVNITDALGCILYLEFVIINPDEITIDLGEDKTLCNEQSVLLDATINDTGTLYQWTSNNGFSSTNPKIKISKSGTYHITVTTSLGCIIEDDIIITTSNQDINSEFLLSSQAYVDEEVILINVSSPKGEITEWLIPSNVIVNEQNENNIKLKFSETGTYRVGLRSKQGECSEEFFKNIIVEEPSGLPDPGDTNNPFIEEFILSPNPNNGNFEIKVKLAEVSPISLRIFNVLGEQSIAAQTALGNHEYVLHYSRPSLPSGIYLIVLETAKGTKIKKMIIL